MQTQTRSAPGPIVVHAPVTPSRHVAEATLRLIDKCWYSRISYLPQSAGDVVHVHVPSESSQATYLVSVDATGCRCICNCPAGEHGSFCKHQMLLLCDLGLMAEPERHYKRWAGPCLDIPFDPSYNS